MSTQTPTKLVVPGDFDPNRAKLFAGSPSPGKAQLKAQKFVESLTGGLQVEHDPLNRDVGVDDLDFDQLDITNAVIDYDDEELDKVMENDEVKQRILKGVDIGDYMAEVEKELVEIERSSVLEYLGERENFASLFSEMSSIESTLGKIEGILNLMSKESRVNNRKNVEKMLNVFINEVNLPKNLKHAIINAPIDEGFVGYLVAFKEKLDALEQYKGRDVKAATDVLPALNDMLLVASDRVGQWLAQKMMLAVRDLENLGPIQKQMLQYKDLMTFLNKHVNSKSAEIINGYIVNTSSLYLAHFRGYVDKIPQLQLEIPRSGDVIGAGENKILAFFKDSFHSINYLNLPVGQKPSTKKSNVFSLVTREKTLESLDKNVPFPIATKPDQRFAYEYIFRCLNWRLMEEVKAEMQFVREFFQYDLSDRIFGRTINLITTNLQEYLKESFDCVGMLVMVCVIWRFKKHMHDQQDNSLNQHFNSVASMLAQRIKFVLDANIQSVASANLKTLSGVTTQPHFATRRYAELLASFLSLQKDFPEAVHQLKLQPKMTLLLQEMELLLQRLADQHSKDIDKRIFLINNLDLIKSICGGHHVESEDVARVDKLRTKVELKYSELTLTAKFKNLMKIVTTNVNRAKGDEAEIKLTGINFPKDQSEAELKEFQKNWKPALNEIVSSVMTQFPNRNCAKSVVAKVMHELYLHYKWLQDLNKAHFPPLSNSQYNVALTELRGHMNTLMADN